MGSSQGPGRAGIRLLVAALVLALLAGVVPVAAVDGVAAPGSTGASPSGVAALDATRDAAATVTPASITVGSVRDTLMLYNQTVASSYVGSLSTLNPVDVAYDTQNGTGWATSGLTVDVFNSTTNLGIRLIPSAYETAILYDNASDTIWVTGYDTENVSVYDATTYALEATLTVGYYPDAEAYDWQTQQVFVANWDSADVTVIDAADYEVVTSVPVGLEPDGIAFDPTLHEVLVANEASHNVTVLAQADDAPLTPIGIGSTSEPGTVLYDAANGLAYVAGGTLGVTIVDPATSMVIGNITPPGEDRSDGLALDDPDGRLYVSEPNMGAVSYYPAPTANVTTAEGAVGTGLYSTPEGIAYDPTDARVLVADEDAYYAQSSNISEISTATETIVGSVGIERIPDGAAYSAAHHAAYVYDGGTGRLYEIAEATDSVNRSVFIGYTSHVTEWDSGSVAYDSVNDSIYVDFFDDFLDTGGVAVVNATTFEVTGYLVAADFDQPSGIAYDPLDSMLFVVDLGDSDVTAVSTVTGTVKQIPVGDDPVGIAYDPSNDGIYVANEYGNTVSVIQGSTLSVVATVPVGATPLGVLFDPANGDVYVASQTYGNLTAISGASNTTVGNIPIESVGEPAFLAYDAVNATIVVGELSSPGGPGGLALVSGNNSTYYGTIPFGHVIAGLAYDSDNNSIFAAATYPGAVYKVQLGAAILPPLSAQLAAVPSTIYIGGSTTFETSTSGGNGNALTYAYSTLPAGCASASEADLPCSPTAPGTYVVGVNVSQSGSPTAAATTTLTVLPVAGELNVVLHADPEGIALGSTTYLVTGVSGGVEPYTYAYSTLPSGCAPLNVSSLECTPTESGTFYVGVNVTDPIGDHGAAAARLTVTGAIAVTLVIQPDDLVLGNATNLTATVTGNVVGTLSYTYTGLPPGCVSIDASQLRCEPTATGSYAPEVEVADQGGHTATANASLTVTSTTKSTPSSGGLGSDWWIFLAVAVAAVVILLVVLVLRRRRPPAPPNGSAPPASPPAPP